MEIEKALDAVLLRHAEKRNARVPILQGMQNELGCLPPEASRRSRTLRRVHPVEACRVAPFHAQFEFTPKGKNTIMACQEPAHIIMGGAMALDAAQRHYRIAAAAI